MQGLLLWWQRTGMDMAVVALLDTLLVLTAPVVPDTVLPPQDRV